MACAKVVYICAKVIHAESFFFLDDISIRATFELTINFSRYCSNEAKVMKQRCADIFNSFYLAVRNNFLTHTQEQTHINKVRARVVYLKINKIQYISTKRISFLFVAFLCSYPSFRSM